MCSALAVSAKIYPAVLLPIALLYVARRRGGREALVGLGIFAAVLAAVLVPFAILSWDGLLHAFTEQARRPLQIESLGSSILLAVADLGGYEPTIVSSFGSQNLSGQLPDTLAGLQTALQIVAVVAVWILFAISSAADTAAARGLGSGRRRVRGLRQGAVAAVPDLADPARGARAGEARRRRLGALRRSPWR